MLRSEADEGAALLELLYLCPVAIVKFDATGAISLMNPHGAQFLFPLATAGNLDNLFDLLARDAPEVYEMTRRFAGRAGRICDEYRLTIAAAPGKSPATVLSLTLHKLDYDVLIAVIADVTATATREGLVRGNEARLHAVFESIDADAMCTTDANGLITNWNRSAERLHGYRADEVIGMPAEFLAPAAGSGFEPIASMFKAAREAGRYEFECWRIRKDGSRFWAASTISVLRDSASETVIGYAFVTRDLTQRRRSDDQLRILAATDPLTGAYNRRAFHTAALQAAQRWADAGTAMTILIFDVARFKATNADFGRDAGDEILRRLVADIYGEVQPVDVIGRYGGAKFLALLAGTTGAGAMPIAERILQRIESTPVAHDKDLIPFTVSIGVAELGVAARDVAGLIRAAEHALDTAKTLGPNRIMQAERVAGDSPA